MICLGMIDHQGGQSYIQDSQPASFLIKDTNRGTGEQTLYQVLILKWITRTTYYDKLIGIPLY